jgi:hypothetical protein
LGVAIQCTGGAGSGYGDPPPAPPAPPPPGAPNTTSTSAPTIDVAEVSSHDGQACYLVVEQSEAGLTAAEIRDDIVAAAALEQAIPPCPDQPAPRTAPPLSPQQLAAAFWYTIRLPVPKPSSRPDFATTGKTTYLETGDTVHPPSWTRATPLGELVITATGTYTVDWGDRSPTGGPYTITGGPYPDGAITHTYDATGTVDIVVREDWTATWHIGDTRGALGGLHTTGQLPDFAVRQIQAVITG